METTIERRKQQRHAGEELLDTVKRRFKLGILSVIALITVFYILAELTLYQQQVDNERIDLTLKQVYLNRQIQGFANQLLNAETTQERREILSKIKQAAAEIGDKHKQVMRDHIFLIGMKLPQKHVYFESPYKLHQQVSDFLKTVDLLSNISANKITADTSQLVVLQEESPGHLQAAFTSAVKAHLASVAKTGEFFMWLCCVMWLLTVIALVMLGLLIFRPVYQLVKTRIADMVLRIESLSRDCRLQEELGKHFKREAAQQKAVLNSVEYVIISTDTYGVIKTFNKFAERKLGYLEIEMVGKHTADFYHDAEDLRTRAEALSQELNKEVLVGFETLIAKAKQGDVEKHAWVVCHKNGHTLHMVLNYRAIFDDQGEITGFLAVGSVD